MALSLLKKISDLAVGKAPLKASRSPRWPHVRAAFLKQNPICAACGGKKNLEVHHIHPFHLKPELELEPSNLLTLCESGIGGVICHLAFGHLGDYRSFNTEAVSDANARLNKLKNRPYV